MMREAYKRRQYNPVQQLSRSPFTQQLPWSDHFKLPGRSLVSVQSMLLASMNNLCTHSNSKHAQTSSTCNSTRKYLLHLNYSEFANCLSEVHLTGFASLSGIRWTVLLRPSRYNISYPPPKMLPRRKVEHLQQKGFSCASHFIIGRSKLGKCSILHGK